MNGIAWLDQQGRNFVAKVRAVVSKATAENFSRSRLSRRFMVHWKSRNMILDQIVSEFQKIVERVERELRKDQDYLAEDLS